MVDDETTYAQPTYEHLWDAFVRGAKEARENPNATEKHFNKAADAYCKLLHMELDPVLFEQLNQK